VETLMIFLVALAGWACGAQAKPTHDDARIKAVIAHFEKNGVKLKSDERGWWVVTDPKEDGYEVIVHLRTFPAEATEQQMHDALKQINLGYMLNAPSRVAMSLPGLRHTDPTKKPPKLDRIPVVVKLKTLFKEYQPPEAKK
jgi:hypothetical protein